MTPRSRVLGAAALLVVSVVIGWALFTKITPGHDLEAYAFSGIALLFAVTASLLLYPTRKNLGVRIFGTFTILIACFWALEFFGGIAMYLADKIARHYQHS